MEKWPIVGFSPGVRVHKGITIDLSLFRSHWLAVVYCLVLCNGSCEPVHEHRTAGFSVEWWPAVADVAVLHTYIHTSFGELTH